MTTKGTTLSDTQPSETPFTFDREDDGSLSVESAVYQALGAASMCWESMEGTGVFNSDRALKIGEALLAEIEATR